MPGSFGCVIYNMRYPVETETQAPSEASDNTRINRFVAWKTRRVMAKLREKYEQEKSEESSDFENGSDSRVAVLAPIRVYVIS